MLVMHRLNNQSRFILQFEWDELANQTCRLYKSSHRHVAVYILSVCLVCHIVKHQLWPQSFPNRSHEYCTVCTVSNNQESSQLCLHHRRLEGKWWSYRKWKAFGIFRSRVWRLIAGYQLKQWWLSLVLYISMGKRREAARGWGSARMCL